MEFSSNNLRMHYEIVGSGFPILLIHGRACDMHLMQGCMEPIFTNLPGFQRIYIDLPGMGQSNAPLELANSDAILAELINFISSLVGDGHFAVAGESFGGYLALGLAAKLPRQITQALLICPMVEPDHDQRILPIKDYADVDEAFFATIDPQAREDFLEFATVANAETYNRFQNEIMVGLKQANRNYLEALDDGYSYTFNVFKMLTENTINPEILILAGRQDLVVGYEDLYQLTKAIPRLSYYAIDKAGHCLQIEQPNIFNAVVSSWLQIK